MRTELAVRIMKIVRIIAVVLIIVSAVLYFTAKEYALYPAIAGFAIIALINIPLNIWLAVRRGKLDKKELDKYEAERKDK